MDFNSNFKGILATRGEGRGGGGCERKSMASGQAHRGVQQEYCVAQRALLNSNVAKSHTTKLFLK